MCLDVCFLGSNFFGILWASWTCMFIYLAKLGNFSFTIISNKFTMSCSSSSPSGTPLIQMLECLKLSCMFLSLSSFFWILISSFFSGWMFISSFCSKLLIWVPVSFPSLLVPYTFSFISLFIAFTFVYILQPYWTNPVSILITSVFKSFDLFFHLGLFFFFLSWQACYIVKGRVLGIHQGTATYITVRGAVCGGTMRPTQLSASFQSPPPLPTSKFGPSGAYFHVGGFVYLLGPCGSLQQTLSWVWEFLLPPQPPQVFSVRGFEALFPNAGTLGFAPSCSSRLSAHRCAIACSYQSGWMFLL